MSDAVATPAVDEPPKDEKPQGPRLSPTAAVKAAPKIAREQVAAGEDLTLDQHLALGYDFIVHGKSKRSTWSPEVFGAALKDDDEMMVAAKIKLSNLSAVLRARGEKSCFVEKTQSRVLTDGLAKAALA